MELERIWSTAEGRMKATLTALAAQLNSWKHDTLDTELLKGLEVKISNDSKTRLGEVASIGNLGTKVVLVRVHDQANYQAVAEGIAAFHYSVEACVGDSLRVKAPVPTAERKAEILRTVRGEGEKAKVKLRDIRRAANEAIKKTSKLLKLPKDVERKAVTKVQELTDAHTRLVESALRSKLVELA